MEGLFRNSTKCKSRTDLEILWSEYLDNPVTKVAIDNLVYTEVTLKKNIQRIFTSPEFLYVGRMGHIFESC